MKLFALVATAAACLVSPATATAQKSNLRGLQQQQQQRQLDSSPTGISLTKVTPITNTLLEITAPQCNHIEPITLDSGIMREQIQFTYLPDSNILQSSVHLTILGSGTGNESGDRYVWASRETETDTIDFEDEGSEVVASEDSGDFTTTYQYEIAGLLVQPGTGIQFFGYIDFTYVVHYDASTGELTYSDRQTYLIGC